MEGELTSGLPQAVAIGLLPKKTLTNYIPFPTNTNQFDSLTSDAEWVGVYIYNVEEKNKHYFTYLHDPQLSETEFKQANRKIIHDLFLLLQKRGMVFDELADIFHNRSNHHHRIDQGRYLVLISLLRQMYEVAGCCRNIMSHYTANENPY
jgi:hypothetical protein